MKDIFYRFLIILSKRMGLWVFRVVTWVIATGYFFLFPGRVAVSVKFYGALFPSRGRFYRLWCSWRQYHQFTQIYLDRLLLSDDGNINCTHEGWEYLEDAVNRKTGGIILMSHVGNWEVAAHMLKVQGQNNPGMNLLLYLGERQKERIERTQKESLLQRGVKIIAVKENGGSPFDIVEGINFLKTGGLVSMTGDRKWHKDQRSLPVRFLGHEAFLPEIPFVFALLSGAPLFIFFAHRTSGETYHFKTFPPVYVHAKDRKDRQAAIRRAAQTYAHRLEDTVRHHPLEWYHFVEPFIGRKLEEDTDKKTDP